MSLKQYWKFSENSGFRAVLALLTGWLSAAVFEFSFLPPELRSLSGTAGLEAMSFPRFTGITLFISMAVWLFTKRHSGRWLPSISFAALAGLTLAENPSLGLILADIGIFVGFMIYGILGSENSRESIQPVWNASVSFGALTACAAVLFFLFVSAWGIGRVRSFSTPSFDFGLFSQMFHSMKTTGLPMTTLERDGLLSHFAVHISPSYYLLLPFYCLHPTPETLQVIQAGVLASGVLPLWKLCRLHGLKGGQSALICLILLLYPAYAGGCGYDLHENCLLTPLLFWLFYGLDRGDIPLSCIAALLTLGVKEDAAVYVAVIGLWQTAKFLITPSNIRKRGVFLGIGLITGSVLWFLAATALLKNKGDGVMTYRYGNFLYGGSDSLVTVIQAVFLNPMKAIFECIEPEKGRFLLLTLVPLLALPVCTRRYERLILLIPYILINLMSDYRYQHDIFFQYTFGSTACLIYLTLVNLADWKRNRLRTGAALAAAALCAVCFGRVIFPKGIAYPVQAIRYQTHYAALAQALDEIPAEESVAAHTFYTTRLSSRETVYDLHYCSWEHLTSSHYIVWNPEYKADYHRFAETPEDFRTLLEESGYILTRLVCDTMEIYFLSTECPTTGIPYK